MYITIIIFKIHILSVNLFIVFSVFAINTLFKEISQKSFCLFFKKDRECTCMCTRHILATLCDLVVISVTF